MSQLDMSGFKKRKRSDRVFKFTTFGERGYPVEFNGGLFQENVRALLEFGQVKSRVCGAMPSWSFQLEVRRHPLLHEFLFVFEEQIELSLELHCKHCQYIGWEHQLICNKNYHFVLPSNYKTGEENSKSSNINIELNKPDQGHKMHGVFHSNGFGHLLCINGSETGSELAGYEIMDFWDRLCSRLGARKVSLKDVATKKGMDLRLIHVIAYGKPWFGRWDYIFGRGSFGVNQEMYQSAIKTIRNIPLNLLLAQYQQNPGFITHDFQIITSRYQILSGNSLITLGDLFHFMFQLKSRLAKELKSTNFSHSYSEIMADASCRWSVKRVEMAIHVVVEALKRAEFRWVSRQHVRDVARAYIGDTGLLDFVLKSLGNHFVGNYFIRRCLNPVTKVLEYCLEDASSRSFEYIESRPKSLRVHHEISWAQIMKDIFYINRNILKDQNEAMITNDLLTIIHVASRIILDTKYLFKEYHADIAININDDEMNKQKIYCQVIFENKQNNIVVTPYHCFMLTKSITFDELKYKVEKTFREIYKGLSDFFVISVKSFSPEGSDLVSKVVKPGGKISFEGGGIIINEQYLLMGVVDCICGTKDDDGERMISCDICQVWQHARCVQIPDTDEIPNIFMCNTCDQQLLRFHNSP